MSGGDRYTAALEAMLPADEAQRPVRDQWLESLLPPPERSATSKIGRGLARGAAELVAAPLDALAVFTKAANEFVGTPIEKPIEEYGVSQLARGIREAMPERRPGDEGLLTDVAEGVGNVGGMVAAGAALGPLGIAPRLTVGALAATQPIGRAYMEAKAAKSSDRDAYLAALLEGGVGALTATGPIPKWAGRVAGVLDETNKATGGYVRRFLGDMAAGTALGVTQVGLSAEIQKHIAGDEDRDAILEMAQALPSTALTMALVGAVVNAKPAGKPETKPPPGTETESSARYVEGPLPEGVAKIASRAQAETEGGGHDISAYRAVRTDQPDIAPLAERARRAGAELVPYEGPADAKIRGSYEDGKIHLDVRDRDAARRYFHHELTHHVAASDPEGFRKALERMPAGVVDTFAEQYARASGEPMSHEEGLAVASENVGGFLDHLASSPAGFASLEPRGMAVVYDAIVRTVNAAFGTEIPTTLARRIRDLARTDFERLSPDQARKVAEQLHALYSAAEVANETVLAREKVPAGESGEAKPPAETTPAETKPPTDETFPVEQSAEPTGPDAESERAVELRRSFRAIPGESEPKYARILRSNGSRETKVEELRRMIQDRFLHARNVPGGKAISEKETLYHGRMAERGREIEGRVDRIVDVMRANGIDLEAAGKFIYARHVADREAALGVGTAGMSSAEASKILSAAAQNPGFAEIGKIHDELHTATRQTLEDAGNLSPQERAAWEAKFGPMYTPLKTANEPAESHVRGSGMSFNVAGRESKKAKGRSSEAFNPLVQSIQDAYEAAFRSEKNRVGQTVGETARANPDPTLWQEYAKRDQVPAKDSEHVFTFKEGGEERFLVVRDQAVLRALRNLDPETVPGMLKWAATAGRFYSQLHTSKNWEFLATNLFRDLQTAGLNLTAEESGAMGLRVVKGTPNAIKAAYRVLRDPNATGPLEQYFREYREAGGMTDWITPQTLQERAQGIEKRLANRPVRERLNWLVDFVEDVNSSVENGVRLSAYAEARKAGASPEKAAVLAKELTVNFSKRGEAGPLLNSLYLFFNARVNGTARMAALFKNAPEKAFQIAGSLAAGGFALSALNRAIAGDDPEDGQNYWSKESINNKGRYAMVEIGDGKTIRLPLAQGLGVFFSVGTLAEHALFDERMKKSDAFRQALAGAFDTALPISGGSVGQFVSPWFLDPAVSLSENKDFAGRAIYSERFPQDQRPYAEVKDPRATAASREVSALLNELGGGGPGRQGISELDVPPAGIDYLVGEAGGGSGRALQRVWKSAESVLSGEAPAFRDLPVVNRFLSEPSDKVYKADFFRHMRAIDAEVTAKKAGSEYDANVARLGLRARKAKNRADDLIAAGKPDEANRVFASFNKLFEAQAK